MNDDQLTDRRNFFKHGITRVAKAASDAIEHKVELKAKHWIRPPFARPELDFLLNCSRCGDCIDACPHGVIFPLPIRRGAEVAATPAMDILNKGCHLCADWPCVVACKDQALLFPSVAPVDETDAAETATDAPVDLVAEIKFPAALDCPPLAKSKVNTTACLPYTGPECGACKGSCPVPDTLVWQSEKPDIVQDNCIGCGLCREACITNPKAIEIVTL